MADLRDGQIDRRIVDSPETVPYFHLISEGPVSIPAKAKETVCVRLQDF